MPISKSAKKAMQVSQRKYLVNVDIRKNLKSAIKKATKENLSQVYSAIDKAAKRYIIHKNKAARIKSRLAKKFSGKTSQESKAEVKKPFSRSKTKQTKKNAKKSASKKKTKKAGKGKKK